MKSKQQNVGPSFGQCRDSVGITVPMYGEMGRVDVGMQNGNVDSLPMVSMQEGNGEHGIITLNSK